MRFPGMDQNNGTNLNEGLDNKVVPKLLQGALVKRQTPRFAEKAESNHWPMQTIWTFNISIRGHLP